VSPRRVLFFFDSRNHQLHTHIKTYSSGVAEKVTDTPQPTLQRLFQRNHITLQPCDVPSKGCGENRGLSRRRIDQIAITTELSRLGLGPSLAAKAAFQFTDRANPGRGVGELFPLGRTVLMGLPHGESKVVNVPPDLSIADVLATDGAAFIIDCGNVVAKVTSKLAKK
jgi:hypothetical protein